MGAIHRCQTCDALRSEFRRQGSRDDDLLIGIEECRPMSVEDDRDGTTENLGGMLRVLGHPIQGCDVGLNTPILRIPAQPQHMNSVKHVAGRYQGVRHRGRRKGQHEVVDDVVIALFDNLNRGYVGIGGAHGGRHRPQGTRRVWQLNTNHEHSLIVAGGSDDPKLNSCSGGSSSRTEVLIWQSCRPVVLG